MKEAAHWTSRSVDAFIHRITFDFITQLEKRMESLPMSQAKLAQKLEVSEGAVSQILNGRRNLTLRTLTKYARALGLKLAIVAYDDNDPNNERGPINSDIFRLCWEKHNKPVDFWSLKEPQPTTKIGEYVAAPVGVGLYIQPLRARDERWQGHRIADHQNANEMPPIENAADRLAGLKEATNDVVNSEQVSSRNAFANLGEIRYANISR